MIKKLILITILGLLLAGFWASPEFQEIAAGVAIFLFGMLMLEDGFKLFSGGILEKMLTGATRSVPRSMAFGVVSTTLMQSSSLVSVITISFLSAGLISLIGGVGIIFGTNIGTTTGAWLVAGFGLKVNISAFAMPMLAVGIVLVFQSSKYLRGIGYVLAGLGFLFLGIHYMKEGFDAFKDQFDMARFAMTGWRGLIIYTLIGMAATVVMQSSHATLVLIITALAAGQVSYENALALAIGANIGTTVTAVIAAFSANYQGKRLALAHFIFNVSTAVVALVFIAQIRDLVDWISNGVGIAPDDFSLKLAVFHTVFNVIGVGIMLPWLHRLITLLERVIKTPMPDVSQPKYLSEAVDGFPETIENALHKEVKHLQNNAIELIAHGLNLHRQALYESQDIADTVKRSQATLDIDIGARYDLRVKTLYAAIIDFSTRAGGKDLPPAIMTRIYNLRDSATRIVEAVKAIKHMRRNATAFTRVDKGKSTEIYNGLRTEIARILVEIHKLDDAAPGSQSALWLDEERIQVGRDKANTAKMIESLIRNGEIDPIAATSFLNDSTYAYLAMESLIEAGRIYYVEAETAIAEVEHILTIEDDEQDEIAAEHKTDIKPAHTAPDQ